ncbi:hypothetical protein C9I99_21045 [Photobacterium lutimaris]|uniref:Replication initiator protein RctB central region domain-containing protein n=2 Tax=Photobacterium lutimaris TaxID=388278 RepID=A0A2T3ITI9_9GAMM|nr:hypothetical protein C9I99_21045 [Photobacterium lutimaris]TDR72687.1 hypothetical protein DFP78_113163 [Photobacterium lutimaris]
MDIELTDIELPATLNKSRRFSIYLFDGTERELNETLQNIDLNSKELTVVQHLILASDTNKVLNGADVSKVIGDQYDIPSPSLSRIIKGLVEKKGVLTKNPVLDNGVLRKQCYCYKLRSKREIASDFTQRELSKGKRGNSKETRETLKKSFAEKGHSLEVVNGTDSYQISTYPYARALFPAEFMSLAPTSRNKENYAHKKFVVGTGKNSYSYVIECKAHSQVPTQQALLTMMDIIKLSLAYNAKMLHTGRFKTAYEDPELPVLITQILAVKGITDSGPARKKIDDHIEELQFARWVWSELEGKPNKKRMEGLIDSDDFIFIDRLKRSNDYAATYENGKVKQDSPPSAYFITLSRRIIDNLMGKHNEGEGSDGVNQWLFVIPKEIVNGDPLLFSLYLTLREMKLDTQTYDFTELKRLMFFSGGAQSLRKQLHQKLSSTYKPENPLSLEIEDKVQSFDFNLCGYYLRFGTTEGCDTLTIYCKKQEMVIMAGSKWNPDLDNNTPTIAHPLSKYISKEQVAIDSIVTEMKARCTTATRRKVLYRNFIMSDDFDFSFILTAYMTDIQVNHLASLFNEYVGFAEEDSFRALKMIQKELKPISAGGVQITSEELDHFTNYMSNTHGQVITPQEVMELAKNFREKSLREWKSGQYDRIVESVFKNLPRIQSIMSQPESL